MRTELPKCAFPILGKPMIEYIVENLERSQIDEIVTIVGHKKEVLMDILGERVIMLFKLNNGQASALSAAPILGDKEGITFILPGDMPLMESWIKSSEPEMGNV